MKRIPKTDEIIAQLKPAFVNRYKDILGDRYEEFIQCSFSFLRRSLRVNTIKMSVDECKARLENNWMLRQVPWCKEGFWIESERRDIGNTIEHALGYIYVQEAASMVPPIVLDPKPGETVLDMAAAPGSKTSQMAAMMNNTGLLVANDIKPDRLKPLSLNMQRCGITNTVMTLGVGQRFREPVFDKILIDAPCSGTGNIRRSLKTVTIWNPSMITRLAKTQLDLLQTAYNALKPNGVVVYSTCSTEPEENEGVIDEFIKLHPEATIDKIQIDGIKSSGAVVEFEGKKFDSKVMNCLRLWPQENDTEGFFVARIIKS
ncbi:MAG: RsmB/NOP family class I SAM-dependent RNA methyltransferase [Nanoarchaeota archaeon]